MQASVIDTVAVTAGGQVDIVNSSLESWSNRVFIASVQKSLGALRFHPAMRGHHRGISLDTRQLTDWSLVDSTSGGHHYGNRFLVTWEGDISGPPASEHLGINQYLFRPTRIISAEPWAVKPCMAR